MTLLPAASMENSRSGANLGTLTCFAVPKVNPGTQVLVSASHVIYEGGRTPGEALKICSPDSGSCCCTKHVVAMATAPGVYENVGGTFVDCAIAMLNSDQVGVNQIPALAAGAQPLTSGGQNPDSYIAGWAEAVDGEAVRVCTWKRATPIQGTVETGQTAKAVVDGAVVERPGQLWITVAKADRETVVEGSGDSGSPVFNRFNQLIGVMWGRGVKDPNSTGELSAVIFACPIGPALNKLEIDIPSAVPAATHAGPALLPVPPRREPPAPPPVVEDDLGRLREAERRLAETSLGRDLLALGYQHAPEVERLVHHDRRVTLVWHRNRGPAWTAHLINASREDDYEIPVEVGGVTRTELLERMHAALYKHGSEALRADLDRWAKPLIAAALTADGVAELLARIEDGALGSPA